MFCKKCGKEVTDRENFCQYCGSSNSSDVTAETTITADVQESIVDLSGQTEAALPQQGKYKPILVAGILMVLFFALFALAGGLFHIYTLSRTRDMLLMQLFLVSVPFAVVSIPFVIIGKKKAAGTQRKLGRGYAVLLYVMTWLTVSVSLVCGFADAFSTFGLVPMFSKIIFVITAVFFVLLCNMYSNQNGAEAFYSLMKAMLTGFILSSPIGYMLGMMKASELMLVVFLIGLIAFFICGGRILIVHRN